jgi:hypothetical protein
MPDETSEFFQTAIQQLDERILRLRAISPKGPPPASSPPEHRPDRPSLGRRWSRGLIIWAVVSLAALVFLPLGCVFGLADDARRAGNVEASYALLAVGYGAVLLLAPLYVYSVARALAHEFRHWWLEDPSPHSSCQGQRGSDEQKALTPPQPDSSL